MASLTDVILSTLSLPFKLLSNILRFLFNVLGIPLPQLHYSRISRPRPSILPSRTHDAWLRELEEETGAVSISTRQQRAAQASGAQAGPSSSSLSKTTAGKHAEEKVLPDFMLCSYEEFLRACERELKIGCIILVSEEHDDVPEFKRSTLTDFDFVNLLQENNILAWGGDVRYRDAWSASEKLQATTYPFIAFVSLQLRRSPVIGAPRSTGSPTMTVLSRHQGPSTPATAPTSALTLVNHLTGTLLPRVSPFLERTRASQRQRERDRQLREEQDRAFEETARRDRERIEARIRQEAEDIEARRLAVETAKQEQARQKRIAEEKEKRATIKLNRRRWARRLGGCDEYNDADAIRVAVSLPKGRVIHKFSPTSTVTELFTFIDTQLIPPECSVNDDPTIPPEGAPPTDEAIQSEIRSEGASPDHWWGFKVVMAYPRQDVPWQAGSKLSDIAGLQKGGSVVVELVEEVKGPLDTTEDDDGYDSEE